MPAGRLQIKIGTDCNQAGCFKNNICCSGNSFQNTGRYCVRPVVIVIFCNCAIASGSILGTVTTGSCNNRQAIRVKQERPGITIKGCQIHCAGQFDTLVARHLGKAAIAARGPALGRNAPGKVCQGFRQNRYIAAIATTYSVSLQAGCFGNANRV